MNISKFLLIEAAFIIASIPLLFLLQGRNKKSTFFRSSNKEEILGKTSFKLPEKEKLLELEKLAIVKGSGLKFDSLIGDWKFITVWKQDAKKEDSLFSSLLRFFSAKLELKKDLTSKHSTKFTISTSIQFGHFTIEFSGAGFLKGEQPYLPFFFNLIEFKSGSKILLSKSLEEPIEKKKSFFELIASGKSGEWLSARGQNGALFLWLKN